MTVAWMAEWALARARPRLMAFNVAIPSALALGLVAGGAPPHHAAAVLTVVFTVFGVFGASVPLVRDADAGIVERWLLAGAPPRGWLTGRLAAQGALDFAQLAPAGLVVAMAGAGGPGGAVTLAGALALALLVGNALGAWVAAAARSLAEAALFGAVVALLLLHLGGVFRTPEPGTWQAAAEVLVPFRLLHEALLGPGAGAPAGSPSPVPALGAGLAFLAATVLLAPRLLGALTPAARV